MPIKLLHVGLGPIGAAIVRQASRRGGLVVGGAVDLDPGMAGRDLGDVVGLRRHLGIKVSTDLKAALRALRPDVAIVSTTSSLGAALPILEAILKAKVPIVSTTEELAYPVKANAALAKRIDATARRGRVAVLGTGVNPGFVMDALPIALTAVCADVTAIEVDRIQDARARRLPFQRKIGAGLTPEEFAARVKAGTVRHVGLAESIAMIAESLGWKLDRVTDHIKPQIADEPISSGDIVVERGAVTGLIQDGVGYRKGKAVVTLHMEAYLGAPDPYDEVRITGSPPLVVRVSGGVHGDIATASIVLNSIPKILQAPPGLRTMRDMVLPSFAGTLLK
ncbi:MAG: dihydrodipicolinate reductase [Acidobacteriota bacterium]